MLITGTAPPLIGITSCTVCHSGSHNGSHSGNTLCPPPNEGVLCTLRLSRLSRATLHVAVATLRAVVVGLRFTHIAARSDSHAWQRRVANLQYGGLEGRNTLRHNIPHGASPLPSGTASARHRALCVVNQMKWFTERSAIYSHAGPNLA